MSALDDLHAAIAQLEDAYERQRRRLERDIAIGGFPDAVLRDPLDMLDSNGRPVLLDALGALAIAKAALAQIEATR